MLGIVFGVGSVVAMISVGEGASKQALEQIRKLGTNNIIITGMKPVEEESASAVTSRMSIYGLTYDDHQRIRETFESVKKAAPVKILRKESRLGEKQLELRVVGTTPQWFKLVERPIIAGRALSEADEQKKTPVAVLTEYGARRLLAGENTIGQFIRIGSDQFQVIGIVKSEGGQAGNIQIPDQEVDAYIPLDLARIYFGDVIRRRTSGSEILELVELHQIIVQVESMDRVESIARAIEEMLARFHKRKDYRMSVPLALLKQSEATKRTFNIVLGSIACISLLVGGIGIMNIMLASVTERTREIGIRRAIGAKRKQIILQFLIETVVLSTTGGLAGVGLGLLVPLMITYFSGMPTVVTVEGVLLPLFISAGIGIIFGLYPARHAANVDPIVALRHE
ncbi:MAG: ABC transporter permease [Proteobacteria bacterium]|nr:ABC transporter permease [Pseudomonadota bacterium]